MINRAVSIIKFLIVIVVGCSVLSSCKDDIIFASENKTMIDTMFLKRKHIMEADIDTMCVIRNEQFYQEAVDSIMEARIKEIETKLNSLKSKSGIQ